MGKLVIKFRGNQIGDVGLKLGDTTIGRDAACDIVLKNDKSVSKKHAVIKTVGNNSTLEDNGSTNGTFMEDKRIQRHALKHGETIIISQHELIYRDDVVLGAPTFGHRPAVPAATPDASQAKTMIITAYAQLLTVEGKDKGKHVPLMKDETLLDNPGKNPARVYRGPEGYVLHAQIGAGEPRLNGKPVPPGGQLLTNGDIIEVTGTKYRFLK